MGGKFAGTIEKGDADLGQIVSLHMIQNYCRRNKIKK